MEDILYKEYVVLVKCLTFNHSQYIEDTLNGFVMQQTDFPFICLVMDDCSTDGEQEVIRSFLNRECDMENAEYHDTGLAEIVIAPHLTNLQCSMAVYFLKQNLYGTRKKTQLLAPWREHCKYEALCEGDDYWIDPLKLQKQVDFLEKNNDYGLCYTKSISYDQSVGAFRNISGNEKCIFNQLLIRYPIPTLTTLYRESLYQQYLLERKLFSNEWISGDYPWTLWLSLHTKLFFMDEVTGVYRIVKGSATHQESIPRYESFKKEKWQISLLYDKVYNNSVQETEITDEYLRQMMYCRAYLEHSIKKVYISYCLIKNKNLSDYIRCFRYICGIYKYKICSRFTK